MARTKGSKNIGTIEYVQLYESLVEEYGCPVKAMFKIINGRYKTEHKINAAKTVLPYRFPKLTAESIATAEQGELRLVWKDGQNVG